MQHRRDFLKSSVLLAGAGLASRAQASLGAAPSDLPWSRTARLPRVEDVLNRETFKPRGQSYQATVPDTLDLAERARLSVNVMTHNVDPDWSYYVFQSFDFAPTGSGPNPKHRASNLTAKNLRALPWLRTMCGSIDFVEEESRIWQAMLVNVRKDGLLYIPLDEGFHKKNTCYPGTQATLALACDTRYAMDGNAAWLDWMHFMIAGLNRVAIRVKDRAYFPPECVLTADGNWVWGLTSRPQIPYNPPDEPVLEGQGDEGFPKFEQAYPMRAMTRAYRRNPDPDILELVERLKRFDLKSTLWENTTLDGYEGNEHGIFGGHFHGHMNALLGLLDLAELQNDAWLKQFVREAYDNAVHNGVARMGWYPCWIRPVKYKRSTDLPDLAEGCAVVEMVELGVRLSDVGYDYWDDVEATVRNQMAEQQYCDIDLMRRVASGGPAAKDLERFVGGFTVGHPTAVLPMVAGCCSANGAIALYYAWEGITGFSDGVATVNMFLNRASSWMDIDSYLPYEGKVELRNKQARTALVRIPNWVELEEVKSFVNGHGTRAARSQRYLVFDGLRSGDMIRLEFPNLDNQGEYTINNTKYRMTFRGNTLIDIEPRASDSKLLPAYQRGHYRQQRAPMRSAMRFAAERILPLQ
jgi:hypothetical protein